MEVSGQFHTPAALPPRERAPVPNGQEAGWAPELVRVRWRDRNKWQALLNTFGFHKSQEIS